MGEPDARVALASAADAFLQLVDTLDASDLERPATDAWQVRELAAHTARAFLATEAVLDAPLDPTTPFLASAADYYRAAFAVDAVHAGIERRARDAAADMGDDPATFARAAAARVLPRVAATPGDREVQHFAGRLRFDAYLDTRVVELVLHSVDLALALDRAPDVPDDAASVTARVVLGLADRADPLALACALAGRRWPPGGVDVLR